MSWKWNTAKGTRLMPQIETQIDPEFEQEFEQVLRDFRANAHAWSAAAYSRPRALAQAARSGLRLALGWGLGCVLVASGLSGALYEHHQREAMAARLAQQARQAQQRQVAARQRAADEDLLAAVDSDIAREVPAAMEPLANLMDEDTGQ